jgi:hypothetical protein
MSQNSLTLPTTGTVSGLQMTQNTNNALDTLNTLASGASAPASPEAGQFWHDTTNSLLKIRSLDNTAWIPFLQLNETAYDALPYFPGQITGSLNRIINGGMGIDQVNEGASYALGTGSANTYSLDQWIGICQSGTATGLTMQRVADAPPGFAWSLKVTVGTGAGSVASGDMLQIFQKIEAGNMDDLNYGSVNALPVSLSFWVKASVAGNYAVTLGNSSGTTQQLVHQFAIATAGVWQSVMVPNIAGPQTGTWGAGINAGLNVAFTIAAGSGDQTSALDSWQNAFLIAGTSQTNSILTTSGATFQITGVMLNPGPFCLPFEKRPVQQELALCQRYYEKTFNTGIAAAQNAGLGNGDVFILSNNTAAGVNFYQWQFATRKRTAPTIVTYNPAAANANWRDSTASADKAVASLGSTEWGAGIYVSATTTVSDNLRINITASARM